MEIKTQNIITDWLNKAKSDYIALYISKGLKASGKVGKETRVEITPNGGEIWTPRYVGALLYGRSPNKDQSPEALRKWVGWAGSTFLAEWVKNKRINANPFQVAWGVARKGTDVPNTYNDGLLYSDTFTPARFNELYKALRAELIIEIKQQTKETWLR